MAAAPMAAASRGCPVAVAPVAAPSLRGGGFGFPSSEGAAGLSGLVELLSAFLPGIAKVLRTSWLILSRLMFLAAATAANVPLAVATAADVPLAATTASDVPLDAATAADVPLAVATAADVPLAATTAADVPLAAATVAGVP